VGIGIGAFAVAAGVTLIACPPTEAVTLALFFSAYLFIEGFFEVVMSLFASLPRSRRILGMSAGVVCVFLGALCLNEECQSVLQLAMWISAGWIVGGLARLSVGLFPNAPVRSWAIGLGLAGIFAGLIPALFPLDSISSLAYISGACLVAIGALQVINGVALYFETRGVSLQACSNGQDLRSQDKGMAGVSSWHAKWTG